MAKSKLNKETADQEAYERHQQFRMEFESESDRAAVILGAAQLDILLYQLLHRFFLPTPTSSDELLEGNSPLATFSSRIQVCYRLGLIDAELTRALNLIRRIRNSFAHEIAMSTLDSGGHRDRVRELVAYFHDSETFHAWSNERPETHSAVSRQFRTAVALVSVRLEGAVDRCQPLKSDLTHLALNEQFESRKKKEIADAKKKTAKKKTPKNRTKKKPPKKQAPGK